MDKALLYYVSEELLNVMVMTQLNFMKFLHSWLIVADMGFHEKEHSIFANFFFTELV